jgi:hypothetical protein
LEHILHGSSRRVADFTFALNYRLHGLRVEGYHITNLAIHLSTSVLIYLLIVSAISALRVSFGGHLTTSREKLLFDQFLPISIALLFVCHPVQTQAVTYIIQRYTSLSAFFYLLSSLLFIRARLALESYSGFKTWLLMGGSLLAGLLALGCKQIAVTLPLMLIVIEIFLFRGRLINKHFFRACGILIIVALSIVLFKWFNGAIDDLLFDLRHATSEDQYFSRTSYFLTQTRVVTTYLSLLCLPLGQNLVHDSPIYTSVLSWPVLASLTLHISLCAIAVILFRTSERNLCHNDWFCGVLQRMVALGIFWFYIAVAVESSIFPIRDIIFEHRIYLPSVGFFMTLSAVAILAVRNHQSGVKVVWALLVVACFILGSMTIARNRIWNDPLTLWQDAASKSPNKWLALANLAGMYLDRRMPEKALPLLVRAMELNPNLYIRTKVYLGESLKDLNIYGTRFTTGQEYILNGGPVNSGILDYSNLPGWESVISNNMGLAYEYLKEPEKARTAYNNAVRINPKYDLAWYNLALFSKQHNDSVQFENALGQLRLLNPKLAGSLEVKSGNLNQ